MSLDLYIENVDKRIDLYVIFTKGVWTLKRLR